MRVITKKPILDAINTNPQWSVGLKLWISIFDKRELRFESYQQITNVWKSASGWNVDRLPSRTLQSDSRKGNLDIYVFDIHKNDFRIITWINPSNGTIYIKDACSHADYNKWWKKQATKGI